MMEPSTYGLRSLNLALAWPIRIRFCSCYGIRIQSNLLFPHFRRKSKSPLNLSLSLIRPSSFFNFNFNLKTPTITTLATHSSSTQVIEEFREPEQSEDASYDHLQHSSRSCRQMSSRLLPLNLIYIDSDTIVSRTDGSQIMLRRHIMEAALSQSEINSPVAEQQVIENLLGKRVARRQGYRLRGPSSSSTSILMSSEMSTLS